MNLLAVRGRVMHEQRSKGTKNHACIEKIEEYGVPNVSNMSTLKSFLNHIKIRQGVRCSPPSSQEEEWLLYEMERQFPNYWGLPSDFLHKSHYERVVKEHVDMTKSPGLLFCVGDQLAGQNFMTNGNLFNYSVTESGEPVYLNGPNIGIEGVWIMVRERIEKLSRGDLESSPIRVFMKDEPTKKTKIEQDLGRLISSVSVVDAIIDHMLFDDCDSVEFGSNCGPSFLAGNVHNRAVKLVNRLGRGSCVRMDKRVWDWTMQQWIPDMDLRYRFRLLKPSVNSEMWLRIATARYSCLYKSPIFYLPTGHLFRQKTGGLQKSGAVVTLSLNSHGQVFLAFLSCKRLGIPLPIVVATGDDTVETHNIPIEPLLPLYKDKLEEAGCLVKEMIVTDSWVGTHFCSNELQPYCFIHGQVKPCCESNFRGVAPVPLNWRKNLFHLKHYTTDLTKDNTFGSLFTIYWPDRVKFDSLAGLSQEMEADKFYKSRDWFMRSYLDSTENTTLRLGYDQE